MNILFDGNYLYHRNFSIFSTYYKDEDIGAILQDKEKQQVLLRKCIIDLCHTVRKFENVERVVFVIDSRSWRYGLYDNYKYALTRVREPYYKDFLAVLQQLEELLKSRGIIVSRVDGAEGDDLLYVWSIYFGYILDQETVIVTGDSDLRQIITKNVNLFNNNSKNLKLYCLQEKEVYWNEKMESDVQVHVTNPFEVLLYKVIMGDGSDNIIKLKKGFGDKAFEKFIKYITPYNEPKNIDIVPMAQWIACRFSDFTKMNEEQVLGQVLFNLKMTWLNLSVYNSMDYQTENGKSLLENMLDDVNNQKNKYSYNKPYTLEDFYNMIIK
jgi:5'-3' exonuclease